MGPAEVWNSPASAVVAELNEADMSRPVQYAPLDSLMPSPTITVYTWRRVSMGDEPTVLPRAERILSPYQDMTSLLPTDELPAKSTSARSGWHTAFAKVSARPCTKEGARPRPAKEYLAQAEDAA